ncbi:MAG: hypothetical protein WEB62_05475, partial [Bacteroidota bacterium]
MDIPKFTMACDTTKGCCGRSPNDARSHFLQVANSSPDVEWKALPLTRPKWLIPPRDERFFSYHPSKNALIAALFFPNFVTQ